VIVKQCSISGRAFYMRAFYMRSEGILCEAFIMSFIGTCVKRDSMLKLTSRSVGCSRIFWIFCMKSIELIM